VSLWPSAARSYLPRSFSGTDPRDPTSDLCGVRFPGTVVGGYSTSLHVSLLRYEGFLIFHPGATRFNCPTDFIAFSIIVYLVVKSNINRAPIPGLLRIIIQDATYYFLVIFTSHFVLVMFLAFARVSIFSYFLSAARLDSYRME